MDSSIFPMREDKQIIAKLYSSDGLFKNWALNRSEAEVAEWAQTLGDFIRSKQLPRAEEQKIKILSPTANKAVNEATLQKYLGDEYLVISGDIAQIQPLSQDEKFYRADAAALPFASHSMSLIYDDMGAVWYQYDVPYSEAKNGLLELFKEYYRVLMKGGLVLVDPTAARAVNERPAVKKEIINLGFSDFEKSIYYKNLPGVRLYSLSKL